MIKPTALICWPLHVDFPVCRWNLERFGNYFETIIIGFSNHHVENENLSNFVRSKLPFCTFIDIKRTREDWRDDAVNNMLDATQSEYVAFMEQDFLIHDENFFEKVFADGNPFVYYAEEERKHPAFAVVQRELIEKTSKDFSAYPSFDHFGKFFQELPEGVNIEKLGIEKKVDFYHMAGLSQNYMNFKYGDPFYHANNFLYYNYKSSLFPNQHPGFQQSQLAIERIYGHPKAHSFLDRFFPNEEQKAQA